MGPWSDLSSLSMCMIILYYPTFQVEHELLIRELNTHLYLKSEKSRQKRTKLVAYMTDSASVGAKGTVTVKLVFNTDISCN